jgi:hypothetical protein
MRCYFLAFILLNLSCQPSVPSGSSTPAGSASPDDSDHLAESFVALHTDNTGFPHYFNRWLARFTLQGITDDPLIELSGGTANHIVYDPDDNIYYATQGYDVMTIDLEGHITLLTPSLDVRWPSGITYDTKRRRVVISSFGNGGKLIAYEPKSARWSLIRSIDHDFTAITYNAEHDRFFALNMWNTDVKSLVVLDAAKGTELAPLNLASPIKTYNRDGLYQLIAIPKRLVLLINDPYASPERLVTIDPISGAVVGRLNDLSFAPPRIDQGVCLNGTSSNYILTTPSTQTLELHVISVYEGIGPNNSESDRQNIDVVVHRGSKPIVLFLSAFTPVDWHISADPNAIQEVYAVGYHDQQVFGLASDTTVFIEATQQFAYGWEQEINYGGGNYHGFIDQVHNMTGLSESSFQACYTGKAFLVGP